MRKPPALAPTVVAALLSLSALAGCAADGQYVWVNQLPAEGISGTHDYRMHGGDMVSIHVFQQEAMVTKARVRSDGRIAFPILGDIEVRGKRPADVKTELEARLKDYVVNPHVTVTVEDSQPISVSVLGEVQRPGSFVLDASAGVAQALASAGGTTDYADRTRIFVVRNAPTTTRIRFTYEAVTRGLGRAATFSLEAGDLVVVE